MKSAAADSLRLALPSGTAEIKAIVFDLDGTLYPRKTVKKAMIRTLFPGLVKLSRYAHTRDSITGCDYGDAASMRNAILEKIASGNRRKYKKMDSWLDRRYYPALWSSISGVPAREGFPQLMRQLAAAGIKLAVVSDYGKVAERLESLGFNPSLFTLMLGTEEYGMMKPAARIGGMIFKALGTAPDETLMVGDRADTDRALAEVSGMPFLGICDGDCTPDADDCWYSWPAFKGLFENAL